MDAQLKKYQGIFPAFYACYNEDGDPIPRVPKYAPR